MIVLDERSQLEVPYCIRTDLFLCDLCERLSSNEFQRPIAVDLVSPGKVCDWCEQPAQRQLTALGGQLHNKSGIFCSSCGEQFERRVLLLS